MPLISLAMIVKNEEAALAHCLESVKDLVDEMVIVDTGSTDNTIAIAQEFGARVYHFQWCDDFSAARNESLKYCKGDWILVLDADEAIDALDYEKIKNACLHPYADAYRLIHRHYMDTSLSTTQDIPVVPNNSDYDEGSHLHFYSDSKCIRLARMFDGLFYSDSIHETLNQSVISSGKTIKSLDAVIHHFGKLNQEREAYKVNYYFMLARKAFDKDPTSGQVHFNLLQQALTAKQWDVALKAVQASEKLALDVHPFVLCGAGAALQGLDRHEEAISYFDILLSQVPEHAPALLGKGVSYTALGNFNAAREFITAAIKIQPTYVPAYIYLADLELCVNNFDAARKVTLDAMNTAPNEPALYDLLLKIESARGDHKQAAQDALAGIQKCPEGGGGLWHRLAVVYLYQHGQEQMANTILELGLKTFPDDPDLTRLKGLIR